MSRGVSDADGLFSLVDSSREFSIRSEFEPKGDQPCAIEELTSALRKGESRLVLLGVTGSGKTFTMANVIERLQRPTLVIAHNKTLAAQLYSEFSELFPDNAVRYFVSYYDYYQPEAYLPATDTYIEKDASINDEIDKLRHSATKALLERRDVIVVASVSCIYGLGDPKNYFDLMLYLEKGDRLDRDDVLRRLVELQYSRNDVEFSTGTFRVRGDVVEISPASESERSIRIEFFGDEIEGISEVERISGKALRRLERVCVYPASHFVTRRETIELAMAGIREELADRLVELERDGKVLEASRLEQRTLYDLEMLDEMGFCSGVENYSRHLTGRAPGEPPPTLLDYFPDDFLVFADESHVTLPQLSGMSKGDRSRKKTLVEFGFRLPSALDNRPLEFGEFQERVPQMVYVSATPGEAEVRESSGHVVEQIIRPTGLLDPVVEIRPAADQVEDCLGEIRKVIERDERVLVTTLTKRMAENLSEYYRDLGLRIRYLHSDITTLDRVEIIRALRLGEVDVLVGINLLREGLDIPEVSLVAVMDADKEGFLRSKTSLIQTMGRAARNLNGFVILYADVITKSIEAAVAESERRREIQKAHNDTHGITPESVRRASGATFVGSSGGLAADAAFGECLFDAKELPRDLASCKALLNELRREMFARARKYEFEEAAFFRDKIAEIERYMMVWLGGETPGTAVIEGNRRKRTKRRDE